MVAASALLMSVLLPQAPRPAALATIPAPPPQDLTLPPETANVVTILEGRGVQIYSCTAADRAFHWLLKAPDAQLFNLATGKPEGQHAAGPTWTLGDGSSIRGTVAATKPGPTPADVPWLLLHTQPSNPGQSPVQGELAPVSYVRRYNTHGGAAPPAGCDAGHVGQELRVPYTASYAFYSVPGAPSNLQQPTPPPPPSPPPPSAQ